ncbi:hypothetical protein H5410_064628 [Solanum commersonii]|uniref:Uncharacterized protein n=1 Tax=Solanum commersonii TaxID=4109 RepID=A0A9J5VYT3_SOLCO|nr:hypothetical protein H5410_064628 [Solanum commersonii]
MKSTIRYIHLSLVLLERDEDKGLNLWVERDLSTKSFVSQSSDPVNEYMQEIETRKGQGQGLTNSTLFTSQGMITIPKNSIDLEKENKQINPSAHASTNLGSTVEGRGQGLKSSTCVLVKEWE